jgi:hypothetical protein
VGINPGRRPKKGLGPGRNPQVMLSPGVKAVRARKNLGLRAAGSWAAINDEVKVMGRLI